MRSSVFHLFLVSTSLIIIATLLPGIHIRDTRIETVGLVAIVVAFINLLLQPLIVSLNTAAFEKQTFLLSFHPFLLLLLSILIFISFNSISLLVADVITGARFEIDSFWWALLGGPIASLTYSVLNIIADIIEVIPEYDDEDDEPVFISYRPRNRNHPHD